MKAAITQCAKGPPQTPVFPKALHRLRAGPTEVSSTSMTQRRDNIFSKSRDTWEDRGERQMKTSHNAQTFTHGR
jgi:hypothetical protein